MRSSMLTFTFLNTTKQYPATFFFSVDEKVPLWYRYFNFLFKIQDFKRFWALFTVPQPDMIQVNLRALSVGEE